MALKDLKTGMIGSMRKGTRFYWEGKNLEYGKTSMMMATDVNMSSTDECLKRLCVSEDGITEWIESTEVVYIYPNRMKFGLINLANDNTKEIME